MLGDNTSVVDSSMIPHAKLHKRRDFLSFHRVRVSIAARILNFILIPSNINPADILSKHWSYHKVKIILRASLFYEGDTSNMFNEDTIQSTN